MSLYKKPQTPKDQSTSSNLDLSSLRKKLKVVVVGSSREDHDKFIQLWLSSEAKNKPQDKNVLTIGDKEWSIEFENIDKIESLTYGDGYIYIYSCNNKQSFGNISQIHGKLQFHYKSRPFARILVGNVINDEDRQVSTMEGLQKGDEVKCPYLETNQVDTNGIGKLRFIHFLEVVVEEICKQILKYQRQERMKQVTGSKGGFFGSVSEDEPLPTD